MAFTTAADGDMKQIGNRDRIAAAIGLTGLAWVHQVHGTSIFEANGPGDRLADADAVLTTVAGLGVAVMAADCVPVVIESTGAVAAVHSGWRGSKAGVIGEVLREFERRDETPLRAAIGPAIGPCCYEVGAEVLASLPEHHASTTWGTPSVDLRGVVRSQLGDVEVWTDEACTMCGGDSFSHRRDATTQRQIGIGWIPA